MKKYYFITFLLLFVLALNGLIAQGEDSRVMSSEANKTKINPYSTEFEMQFDDNAEFPMEIFQAPLLESVSIMACGLKSIPKEIGNLKKLIFLNFNSNKLTKLPDEINALSKLAYLNLSSNKLIELPANLGNLKALEQLDLRGNELTSFPKSICQLANLKSLDLSANQFRDFPEEINQLTKLEIFSISLDSFKQFPKQISSLKQLKRLECWNSSDLDLTEISKLENLNELSFSFSTISVFPNPIFQLKNLKRLNLFKANLKTIPNQINQLKDLEVLDLRDNQITNFSNKIQDLKKLNKLSIGGNPLSFQQVKNIRQLLPNCKIDIFEGNYYYRNYAEKGKYDITYLILKEKTKQNPSSYNEWYSLSWYSLFVNKPKDAIEAAQKVIRLDASKESVESNLALGYLLNNQWKEAEKIYLKWKGKTFPNETRLCDTIFLKDIEDLEKTGIKHKNFEKVKKIFSK